MTCVNVTNDLVFHQHELMLVYLVVHSSSTDVIV